MVSTRAEAKKNNEELSELSHTKVNTQDKATGKSSRRKKAKDEIDKILVGEAYQASIPPRITRDEYMQTLNQRKLGEIQAPTGQTSHRLGRRSDGRRLSDKNVACSSERKTVLSVQGTVSSPVERPKTPRRTRSTRVARPSTQLPVIEAYSRTMEKKKEVKESPVSKSSGTKTSHRLGSKSDGLRLSDKNVAFSSGRVQTEVRKTVLSVQGTVSSPEEGPKTPRRKRSTRVTRPCTQEAKSDGREWRNTGCTILVQNMNHKKMNNDKLNDKLKEKRKIKIKDKLYNLFSIYGAIVRIKLPRGLPEQALVQLHDPEQAERAVQFLEGAKLYGRHLKLSIYKHDTMSPTSDTYSYKNSYVNGKKDYSACCAPTKLIRVSNLSPQTTQEDIDRCFEEYGTITSTRLVKENGKVFAHVMFDTEEQATEALVCMHHTYIHESRILVAFSE